MTALVRPGRGWPLRPMRPVAHGFHRGLPPGDVPSSAFELTVGGGSMIVDNTTASREVNPVSSDEGTYYFYETPSMWLHFLSSASGTLEFSISYPYFTQVYMGPLSEQGIWDLVSEDTSGSVATQSMIVMGGIDYWIRFYPSASGDVYNDVGVAWSFTPRAAPVLLASMLDPPPPALVPAQQVVYPDSPTSPTSSADIALQPLAASNALLLAVSSLPGPPDYTDFGVLTVSGVAGTWTLLDESPDFNDVDGTTPVDNKTYLYLGTDLDVTATTITIDQSAPTWLAANVSEWPMSFTLAESEVGADRVYFTGGVPTELALNADASSGDFVFVAFGPDWDDPRGVSFAESPGVWGALTEATNQDPYLLAFYTSASAGSYEVVASTISGSWDTQTGVLVVLTPGEPLGSLPHLDITPGVLTISIGNGTPETDYVVTLDGGSDQLVMGTLDLNGSAYAVAVPLPAITSGTHTLTVTSGDASVDLSFAVLKDVVDDPTDPTDPTDPVPPAPVVTARWQIHDTLSSDGFEPFIFEINPDHSASPYAPRVYTAETTTAPDGQALTWQAARKAAPWSFDGYLRSQEQLEGLAALFRLNRQVWIIDDLGLYYIVTLEKFDVRPVRDTRNPYRYQYTATVLLYYLPFTLGNFYPPPTTGVV